MGERAADGKRTEKDEWKERWRIQLPQMMAGKPQSWLVAKTGIHQSTVSKWFTGERGPNMLHLGKVAEAFGLRGLPELLAWTPGVSLAPREPVAGGSDEDMVGQIEKVRGRVDAFIATKPSGMSEPERELFLKVASVMNQAPGMDLTGVLLDGVFKTIKMGFGASGSD